MRPRLTLLGFWLAGTAFAMLLAALAVQLAGAKVTDARGAVISKPQVESELAMSETAASPDTVTRTSDAATSEDHAAGTTTSGGTRGPSADDSSTGTAEAPGASSPAGPPPITAPAPANPRSGPAPAAAGPTTTIDDHGGGGGGSPGGPPTTTGAPSNGSPGGPPPTAPVASSNLSTTVVGGSVAVHCDGATVRVTSASPATGFAMDIKAPGPGSNIEVRFTSPSHDSELKANCSAGVITVEPREISR